MSKKPEISGSFGPGVVVTSGKKKMINIAGGSNSGDVYREVESSSQENPFDSVREVISQLELPEPQKEEIRQVVSQAEQEIARGPEVNVGLIDLILRSLQTSAPRVLQSLAQAIAERTTCSATRSLALQVLHSSQS